VTVWSRKGGKHSGIQVVLGEKRHWETSCRTLVFRMSKQVALIVARCSQRATMQGYSAETFLRGKHYLVSNQRASLSKEVVFTVS